MSKKEDGKIQSFSQEEKCITDESQKKGATSPFNVQISRFIQITLIHILVKVCENTNWNVEIEIVYQLYL
jgi:hypothetical protein